jgi:hypothetical protein
MMIRASIVIAMFALFGLYVMDYNDSLTQCELERSHDTCVNALR